MNKQFDDGLSLVLEPGAFSTLRFSCFLNGRRLSPDSGSMPSSLRPLARRLYSMKSIEDELLDYLDDNDDDIGLFLLARTGDKLAFSWDPTFSLSARVCFDAVEGQIHLRKGGVLPGGSWCSVEMLGGQLMLDRDSRRMGRVSGAECWQFVDLFSAVSFPETAFFAAYLEAFNEFEGDLEGVIVTAISGMVVASDAKDAGLVCRIGPDGEKYGIEFGVDLAGSFFRCSMAPASQNYLFLGREWAKTSFESDSFGAIKAVFDQVLSLSGDTFDWAGFYVAKRAVFPHLSTLVNDLEALGMSVSLSDKPLSFVDIDVSVIADYLSDDVMGLNFEAKMGNTMLSVSDLMEVVAKHGVLSDDDTVQMLSATSLEMIRSVLRVMPEEVISKKSKKWPILQVSRFQLLDWLFLKQKGVAIQIPEAQDRLLQQLLDRPSIDSVTMPKGFRGKLRQYQKLGYDWLMFLYRYRLGACLADDMGLGKTIQTLVFLSAVKENVDDVAGDRAVAMPHLVVVPPSLLFNWRNEITQFLPGCRIGIAASGYTFPDVKSVDIVLSTYDYIRRHVDTFKAVSFDVIVLDEAQFIKNIQAARTEAVRQLQGRFVVALTGTPVENHLGDFYSIMDMVLPRLFGAYDAFMSAVKAGETSLYLNRSKPFVLRRSKSTILKELPEKIESDVRLRFSEEQGALYKQLLLESQKLMVQKGPAAQKNASAIQVLTLILRLRQCCVSPQLLDDKLTTPSPKVSYLDDQLRQLVDEGHSAIVFSQFRSFLDILSAHLTAAGFNILQIDGRTTLKKREKIVTQFQESEAPHILLSSLKTGGVGLNLTRASYVFHVDPWWNPAVEDQASDRVHRMGQQQTVFVQRLVMHESIEEKLLDLKEKKKELFKAVIDTGSHSKVGLSRSDFEFLLNPDAITE